MPRSLLVLLIPSLGCTSLVDFETCESSAPIAPVSQAVTWHQDVAPIIEGRCARCHQEGGLAPFPLTTYDEVFALRTSVREAVVSREMPPWLPADCCNVFEDDYSLAPEQVGLIDAWVEQGAPEGDPQAPADPLPSIGGLSRVDLELSMPEAYTPVPAPGRVDDFRCFVIDWPMNEPMYVTGFNPRPGARAVLHHLVVALVDEDVDPPEADDGRPGFPCEGGLGEIAIQGVVGGGLLGGDFPDGMGQRIEPDQKLVLSVHYSMSDAAPEADLTRFELKLEPGDADIDETRTIPLANPAWLIADAMRIPAGEPAVQFRFQFRPSLYTRGKPVRLRGFTPHMHYLGDRMIAGIVRDDGTKECLTDIPHWEFGWEQPYWFAEPIELSPKDELYIECVFDNTLENQPIVGGRHAEPRDVAWGTDNQDMCAGFVAFTEAE